MFKDFGENYKLFQGDCLDMLRSLKDCSVDAVVTDPPYGLGKEPNVSEMLEDWMNGVKHTPASKSGFMGEEWDAFVPDPEIWRECMRVLKPGGHIVAFAGSRTYDLMALALRIAGAEIRDQIIWMYGTGWPKNHDVSKAIDKMDAANERRNRSLRVTEWIRGTGVSASDINEATGTFMGSHYITSGQQPAIPTREHLELIRPLLPDIPGWLEEYVDDREVESENFKKREVVGQSIMVDTSRIRIAAPRDAQIDGRIPDRVVDITEAYTKDAKKWEGWGTALKPSHEPAVLARKPFKGTVAANVLKHGTGAINVDGSRIPFVGEVKAPKSNPANRKGVVGNAIQANSDYERNVAAQAESVRKTNELGKYPANIIHDGSKVIVDIFPETKDGSAAGYFYCPKASGKEKWEGLEKNGNNHPTTKPVKLMEYLCSLVTQPGGLIVDPFMGSGTTGKAAVSAGFKFIGAELDSDYYEIAKKRIDFEEKRAKVEEGGQAMLDIFPMPK